MIVLIDNGHGTETPGKRSPDGVIREGAYCRDIAQRLSRALSLKGVDARLVTPEDGDTTLKERCRRVNSFARRYGRDNVVFVSLHLNASTMGGEWGGADGWQACVAPNASKASKDLAGRLAKAAASRGLKVRRQRPGQAYWVQDVAVCRDTDCPAVLTENLFMDNRKDRDALLTDKGRDALVSLHVDGILSYLRG